MVPACERLERHDPSTRKVDDWLKVSDDLAAVERFRHTPRALRRVTRDTFASAAHECRRPDVRYSPNSSVEASRPARPLDDGRARRAASLAHVAVVDLAEIS
jgi:hypothetical protein